MDDARARRGGWSWWYLLFVVQTVAVIWVPFFNRVEPTFIGIPFFYWYQLAWVPVTALLIWLVYRRQTPDETP